MKIVSMRGAHPRLRLLSLLVTVAVAPAAFGQHVTFSPYIQLGDNGTFGATDQIVVAWQTDEAKPSATAYKVEFHAADAGKRSVTPSARVVDNYLAADPALPTVPTAYGDHANYTAVLADLKFDTQYSYRVTGPGLPQVASRLPSTPASVARFIRLWSKAMKVSFPSCPMRCRRR